MPSVASLSDVKEVVDEKEEFILLAVNHPLLMTYEIYIGELERANKELFSELRSLKTTHEQLEKNATDAYQRLSEKTEELISLTDRLSGGNDELDFLDSGVGVDKELNDIIELLKKEQEILSDEVRLAKAEALKYRKECENQAKLCEEYEMKLKDYQKKCFTLQNELEVTGHNKEVLTSNLSAAQAELKNIKEELDEYQTQKVKVEGEMRILQNTVGQYKVNYEELDMRRISDMKQLEKELNDKGTISRNLKSKLLNQEKELTDIKDINRQLQRELEETKKIIDEMAKLVEENSLKRSLFNEREDSLRRKEQEMKRKIAESKALEQEFLQKEKQYKRQISQLEEQWKQDVDERQKKYTLTIETAKNKQKALIDKHNDDYNDLYERYGKLESNLAKVEADYRGSEQEYRQLSLILNEERRSSSDKNKELEQEILSLKKRETENKRTSEGKLEEAQETITQLKGRIIILGKEIKMLTEQLETAEKKAKANEERVKDLGESLAETTIKATSTERELEQLRDVKTYPSKVWKEEESVMKITNEDSVQYILKQQELITGKLREEKYNSMKYYENVINELNSKVRKLQTE